MKILSSFSLIFSSIFFIFLLSFFLFSLELKKMLHCNLMLIGLFSCFSLEVRLLKVINFRWNSRPILIINSTELFFIVAEESIRRLHDCNSMEVPHEFICPITQQIMINPVTCSGGCSR